MAARLKAAAQHVPQNLLEAEQLAVAIGENMREIAAIEAELAANIAALKLAAKTKAAPIGTVVKAQFAALTTFAQSRRDEILPADRKSLAIAAGVIGWRLGNPTVQIEEGMEDAIIDFLRANAGDAFLIETTTISKAAILTDPDFAEEIPHLAITQEEHFYFKLLDVDLEQTKKLGAVPLQRDAA